PRFVRDASSTAMCATSTDGFVFEIRYAGRIIKAPRITGPRNVATRNHLERTRSVYSRSRTARSLPMPAQSLLDAGGADLLQEDLVQRRLHELEPFDRGTGVHEPTEEQLRVGGRRELDLVEPVLVIDPADERPVREDRGNAV